MNNIYTEEFYNKLKSDHLKENQFRKYYVPEILSMIDVKSFIDIGCGTGMLLSLFKEKGVAHVKGVDLCNEEGLMQIPKEDFINFNLNHLKDEEDALLRHLDKFKYDCVSCLEVAEHLSVDNAKALVHLLTCLSDVVWFSAAIPFQGGDGHINEQWPEYWEKIFLELDYVRVDWFRRKFWDEYECMGYYRQNMLLYIKRSALNGYPKIKKFYETENDLLPKHVVHPTTYSYSVKHRDDGISFEKYPKTKLLDKHLENAQLLQDRDALLYKLPKNGVCAEVGVATGEFSRKIIDICCPKKLYCIDIWLDEEAYEQTKERLRDEISSGQVVLLRGDSRELLETLKDESLDFVYIDAMHDYEHPRQELDVCRRKVVKDGLICGHDYTLLDIKMSPIEQYGVVEAVNQFVVNNDYEFIYFTMEHLFMNPSYCIRKRKEE